MVNSTEEKYERVWVAGLVIGTLGLLAVTLLDCATVEPAPRVEMHTISRWRDNQTTCNGCMAPLYPQNLAELRVTNDTPCPMAWVKVRCRDGATHVFHVAHADFEHVIVSVNEEEFLPPFNGQCWREDWSCIK